MTGVVMLVSVKEMDEAQERAALEHFGAVLKKAREAKDLEQKEFADKIGRGQSYVSKLEKGKATVVEEDLLPVIAKVLDLKAEDLAYILAPAAAGRVPSAFKKFIRIDRGSTPAPTAERSKHARPVVTTVSAGPLLQRDEIPSEDADWIEVDRTWTRESDTFWVIVTGDSMIGEGIEAGDRVLVERRVQPKDGDLAVVWLDGELGLKRWDVVKEGRFTTFWLRPANPDFKPFPIKMSEWIQKKGVAARVAGWLPGFRRPK